ncbi:MAG: alpha/beta hydrolase [Nocardioides sp.]
MSARSDRPSLRHQFLAWGLPRWLGVTDLIDEESERAGVLAKGAGWPVPFPSGLVPRFERRFELSREVLRGTVEFPSYVVTPRDVVPTRTVFYVHGGSFTAPLHPVQVRFATRLAAELGARVVFPDYPLAPRHTWKDSFDALVDDAHRWREESPDGFFLAGDSAGGGLALAVAIGMRERGYRAADRMLLLAPWVDLTTSTPETAEFAKADTWLKYSKLDVYAHWWAGAEEDLGRPEVSPGLADLSGLPPTLMIGGTRDLLATGCRLLADRALAAGWDLTYLERPGLIHVFPLFPGIPEAERAFGISARFLAG